MQWCIPYACMTVGWGVSVINTIHPLKNLCPYAPLTQYQLKRFFHVFIFKRTATPEPLPPPRASGIYVRRWLSPRMQRMELYKMSQKLADAYTAKEREMAEMINADVLMPCPYRKR
eukprot:GHVO01050036.1.p2 GENE.GHVO01050036.1~~GHVO01050036.1.p2  ORF type:complete len:116 (-),score=15.60 GHVO01050036.1:295-642(-)